jgi:peptide/nickel transport system substrate-binding protein
VLLRTQYFVWHFLPPANAVGQAAAQWRYLVSVTATDKYTVVFKWSIPNPEFITEVMESAGRSDACIESPDAVKTWGDVNNWQHAIGTGPFILTDFIDGSSATLVKNPGYWGTDERYPQNKLPYIDKLIVLIIPDDSTALAGLRTGKIDVVDATLAQTAQQVAKTNPQISQISVPYVCGFSLDPRNDMKPFNDIRVREAMQMAINLPQIATTYYLGAASPNPVTLTSQYMVGGWGSPYDQWPQALKDQFAYNPTAATQLLAAAGYPSGFTTDIVVDTAYDMNLLQIIKAEFAAININLNITALDLPSWNAFVQTNHKNDALATRSTSGIMGNTYEPMIAVNKFLTGNYGADWAMVSDPGYDALYAQAMAATSTDSAKQIMKNVNEYVAQQHYVISLLQPVTFSLVQPWLKGYSGQYGATYGSSGPPFLFFYAARFWIAK